MAGALRGRFSLYFGRKGGGTVKLRWIFLSDVVLVVCVFRKERQAREGIIEMGISSGPDIKVDRWRLPYLIMDDMSDVYTQDPEIT